jgi:Na+/H+ antiporter NhaD/arsenite permease-like protein
MTIRSERHPYALVVAALVAIFIGYGVAALLGGPQRATRMIVNAGETAESPRTPETAESTDAAEGTHAPKASADHGDAAIVAPPFWTALPFAALLACIAMLPLIPQTSHWWESNLHKFYLAAGLATVTLLYYLLFHGSPIHAEWPAKHLVGSSSHGLNVHLTWAVFANAILVEFIPFIALLFSLYTISGGIRLEGDLPAHPVTNTAFLAIGSVLASIIGTTGAAMLLIRPLLATNSERKHVAHTVVFFIFIVCNCGGCLLPTGDPPLFLGYLMGVPFLWTAGLWQPWLFVNGSLLAIYFLWDLFYSYPREFPLNIALDETQVRPIRITGLWPNGILLLLVVLCVAMLDPGKPVWGTPWRPWLYLREIVLLGLVCLSLVLGRPSVRRDNGFNFGAIVEVAVLFLGIFVCMQPPLQMLSILGPSLGLTEPWYYFWASGSLSSFLDNAPTYVVFFETAKSVTAGHPEFAPAVGATGVFVKFLIATSLGAVFMGANTYIGNGPNFMVKAIAESSGVRMPTFFGYMVYSGLILIPLFIATAFLFVR